MWRDWCAWVVLEDGSMELLTSPSSAAEVLRGRPHCRLWTLNGSPRPLQANQPLASGQAYQLVPSTTPPSPCSPSGAYSRSSPSKASSPTSPSSPRDSQVLSRSQRRRPRALLRRNSLSSVLRHPTSVSLCSDAPQSRPWDDGGKLQVSLVEPLKDEASAWEEGLTAPGTSAPALTAAQQRRAHRRQSMTLDLRNLRRSQTEGRVTTAWTPLEDPSPPTTLPPRKQQLCPAEATPLPSTVDWRDATALPGPGAAAELVVSPCSGEEVGRGVSLPRTQVAMSLHQDHDEDSDAPTMGSLRVAASGNSATGMQGASPWSTLIPCSNYMKAPASGAQTLPPSHSHSRPMAAHSAVPQHVFRTPTAPSSPASLERPASGEHRQQRWALPPRSPTMKDRSSSGHYPSLSPQGPTTGVWCSSGHIRPAPMRPSASSPCLLTEWDLQDALYPTGTEGPAPGQGFCQLASERTDKSNAVLGAPLKPPQVLRNYEANCGAMVTH